MSTKASEPKAGFLRHLTKPDNVNEIVETHSDASASVDNVNTDANWHE